MQDCYPAKERWVASEQRLPTFRGARIKENENKPHPWLWILTLN